MSSFTKASAERVAELHHSLADITSRVRSAASSSKYLPTLVAVSKYKPASDILACYESKQLDFGENYVQELVEKAKILPNDIRWHFIGTFQSNKAKTLAAIPNLHSIQTLSSNKAAMALQKALPNDRSSPLSILIQVNTSAEDAKSGLPSIDSSTNLANSELVQLCTYILRECPSLRLEGLMTIGSLDQSLNALQNSKNLDFEKLIETRDILQAHLSKEVTDVEPGNWGEKGTGRLILSMGMSSDFEAALNAGSDIVRVGTGIFGQRVTTAP